MVKVFLPRHNRFIDLAVLEALLNVAEKSRYDHERKELWVRNMLQLKLR